MGANTSDPPSAVSEAEVQLLWALLQVQGTKGVNWGDVAKFLKPDDPEKTGTVNKRWSRLKVKLEKDHGTFESKGIELTTKVTPGSSVSTPKGKKPTNKRAKGNQDDEDGDDAEDAPSPSKKIKAETKDADETL